MAERDESQAGRGGEGKGVKAKVSYKPPKIVPLGEMAKGLGRCMQGGSADPVSDQCTNGTEAAGGCSVGEAAA
jgi:hypothetical protein